MTRDCLDLLIETSRRTKIRDRKNAHFNGKTTEIYRQMYRRGGNIKKGREIE